ncbi:MAG: DNA gyrase subunit B, partial [Lachnospiraceae bacterium]|nr:DNA gyrase subunit B [Lachnospiraceae bacterium]
SVDEHLAGFCDTIKVTLEKNGSCTVEDNGRGIPVGMHEKGISAARLVFTTLHAGGKFDHDAYKTSGGLHGVGSSVVNALSVWLDLEVYLDGKVHHDRYERGTPVIELEQGLLPVTGKTRKSGTKINFLPDPEIFEKTRFKEEDVKSRLHETAYLNPKLTIVYEDKRGEEIERVQFHEEEGIVGFVKALNRKADTIHDVVYFQGESEGIAVEAAFQYTNEFHENVLGFCNNIYNAEGGTHLTGFKTVFTTVINSYARELGILKEKDSNFTGADVRSGLTAIISLKHPDPRFEGQTKTKLDNQDAARITSKITGEEIQLYFDKNLDNLKKVISCAEKSAKIRKAEEKAKTNLLTKQRFSFDSNGKLANCESRDTSVCEIFIVEGDSAGGSAKTARDRNYQAILPIRGKILNVEKASIDKVLANAEIKTMINAFGCGFSEGYGNDFDISKLKYDKIIIMADADVDGAHISTLLLTLFYRFMPELIFEGHIYIAMPPLYKAIPSRGAEEYLYDDVALEKYRKRHKGPFTLQRYKGLGEMDADQLWETTLNPDTRMLKLVEIEDARMASDVTELLMGTEVPPRREFIHEHAQDAELDI